MVYTLFLRSNRGGVSLYEFCRQNRLLVEELISQHEAITEMYADAVNTIRYITLNGKPLGAVFRMGVNGSAVDNASSGGIYAEVDLNTGILITPAFRYNGEKFLVHPDSGNVILGYQIPKWDECRKIVEQASHQIEGIPLIGWDIAVTPDGPVFVEVNEAPDLFILQQPRQRGVRKRLCASE